MLRLFFILVFISGLEVSKAQTWQYLGVDSNTLYTHEYSLMFENLDDSCTYKIERLKDIDSTRLILTDVEGHRVIFSRILVYDLEYNLIHQTHSDFYGRASFLIPSGNYKLKVESIAHDDFLAEFDILPNESFLLKIELGLAPELDHYKINSKAKLSETEMELIANCLKRNKKEKESNCSDKDRFIISIHI